MSNTPIQLIVGLGNPGEQYENTRHNAGYWFVDALAEQHNITFRTDVKFSAEIVKISIKGRNIWLLKPLTFMNRSGLSVSALANYFNIPIDAILVAHDELDFPAGIVKLKKAGGHGGHNGLKDIIKAINGREFLRLRIGIDRPSNTKKVVDYVLSQATKDQSISIDNAIARSLEQMDYLLQGEFQKAMNALHQSN